MAAAVEIDDNPMVQGLQDLTVNDQEENCTAAETDKVVCETSSTCNDDHNGDCAICFNKIVLQETALVKGCEHAYCVTCILRWASCKKEATCPQCKIPFDFLNIHRTLDGSIRDFMFEESVCLLLRAAWFKPLVVVEQEEVDYEIEDYFYDDDDLDDVYLSSSSSLRIGNRRWGDNGFVRSGRQEARPVHRSYIDSEAGELVGRLANRASKRESAHKAAADKHQQHLGPGSSHQPMKKDAAPRELVGRRAKRALKRKEADKAAAEKHQQHLLRLGRA